jgi:DNA processing protein
MMTARLASSYSRDVYVLPGRIDDQRSQGCNELLRTHIAAPITSMEKFAEGLGLNIRASSRHISIHEKAAERYSGRMSDEKIECMGQILLEIRNNRGITVEELSEKTGLGYARTSEFASILELDSLITIDLLQRCSINPQNI